MRARNPTCSLDSPHSGRACAATSSYCPTRSRHSGCSVTRSATMRFTRGRVRLASARVKYLRGTVPIYAEMQKLELHFLFAHNHYPLNEFWMRYEPHHSLVLIHDDNGRAY